MSLKDHFIEKALRGRELWQDQMKLVTGNTATTSTMTGTPDFLHQIAYDTANNQFFIHNGTATTATSATAWVLLT